MHGKMHGKLISSAAALLQFLQKSETLALQSRDIERQAMTKPASAPKTATFLLVAVLANSFGNLLLAMGMDRLPAFSGAILPHYLSLLLTSPYLIPGTVLSAIYMLSQLSLFSWADLSFVVPVIASSYVVTTLLSEFS